MSVGGLNDETESVAWAFRTDRAEWAEAGVISWAECAPWSNRGFTAREARDWDTHGFDAERAEQWNTFTPSAAWRWSNEGFTYGEAREWADGGFRPEDAEASSEAGYRTPQTQRDAFDGAGISANEQVAWVSYGFSDPESVAAWRDVTGTADVAHAWEDNEFSPSDAAAWRALGYPTPGDIPGRWWVAANGPAPRLPRDGTPRRG